jgi:thioredoxin reductase
VTGLDVTDDRLTGVLVDGRVVAVDALFVQPRVIANDTLLTALGAKTDDDGSCSRVLTDDTGQTSVPGVYAAGNITDPVAQVIDAAAAGSRAGICINADLVREDTGHAVALQRRSA